MRTIGITGGTGLIGSQIVNLLSANGYEVVILTRNISGKQPGDRISYALWNAAEKQCDTATFSRLHAVIHLAGEAIANHRWTTAQKHKITASRVEGTKFLVQMLREQGKHCKTLIAASATGYYGEDTTPPTAFTEDAPAGSGFLANTCILWENEINRAQDIARTVIIRNGIVLAKNGGAFPELIRSAPFRILPIPGNGHQTLSWIHNADMAALYVHALETGTMQGVYNGVAPQPVSYNALIDTIAQAKGGFFLKPHIPAPLLKLALGEMSVELLKSTTVNPLRTAASGFTFQYPDISSAVQALLSKH